MAGMICGTGSCVPEYAMDNHEIAEMVETSDAWIQERTGVIRRHIAKGETTVSMAVEAAKKALADANITAEELDMILVSTISSNVILPCAACDVQKELGADRAVCFDLNAACTGFVLVYNTAMAYLHTGMYEKILVIGSETLSKLTNWKDRGTCILFGDGAGAVVLQKSDDRLYRSVMHSDGKKGIALSCVPHYFASSEEETYMQMDGQEVFKFAVKKVPEVIQEVLKENEMDKSEIDWFLLHQANKRIVEAVAKRMGVSLDKFPMNMQEYGNTSSASIPILLDEMKEKGLLKKGQKMIIAGFGAGLTWGASIVEWKKGE